MIKQRISALLNLPQTYLMFYGNNANFFASLVIKYSSSSVHAQTAIFDTEFNNTSVDYPVFFRRISSLHNTTTKDELVTALAAQLTEEDVSVAETYMSESLNPVFPVPRLINEYFAQHPSVAIISKTLPWLDYLSALSVVKFHRTRDQVADYHDFIHTQFKNKPDVIYPYSAEQVLDYMYQHDIERVAGFRLQILFALLSTSAAPSIEEVFESSLADLYKTYRYVQPTTMQQQLRDILPLNNKKILYIEDVVTKPATFARAFNISNENCFKEIQEWHRQNIELMTIHGFQASVKA
jgi:hypothetical protein